LRRRIDFRILQMDLVEKAMMRLRLAASMILAAATTALLSQPLAAQSWPARPVTLVVTFAAGGPSDGIARLIANEIGEKIGQRVVVENRGGAGGNIGAAAVAKAPADGYTLLMVSSGPGAVNKLIYKSLPYDPLKDFAPVVLIANVPTVILASPKLPVADLKDVLAYGKRNPNKLNVGNAGYGTGGHIAAVLFADKAGIALTHVPYRGVGPMLTDITSGQVELGFAGFVPQVRNMKALAITAATRAKVLPDTPTVREATGLDVVGGVWYGLLAPAGTPRPIIDRVNAAVNDFLKTPRGQAASVSLGMETVGGTPEAMGALMAADIERLGPVIRAAKISID
jgi:tripartite-type tricarboxylate transporter receptor subunit TctC